VQKLDQYRAWGVRHVWLIDPWQKNFSVYGEKGLSSVDRFCLTELEVEFTPEDIFE
jgi:hypothetical protein